MFPGPLCAPCIARVQQGPVLVILVTAQWVRAQRQQQLCGRAAGVRAGQAGETDMMMEIHVNPAVESLRCLKTLQE